MDNLRQRFKELYSDTKAGKVACLVFGGTIVGSVPLLVALYVFDKRFG